MDAQDISDIDELCAADKAPSVDEFSWLETDFTGLEHRTDGVMNAGGQLGKDRIWYTDGHYIWFRRNKANPATLERHNKFCATGDYKHVETQGDVEVYELQEQSAFKIKSTPSDGRQLDLGRMDLYNIRRQAALAAVKRDWPAFLDIMSYLRERIMGHHGTATSRGEVAYGEMYMAVMEAINQRNGPSPDEVNRAIHQLRQKRGELTNRVITFGRKE